MEHKGVVVTWERLSRHLFNQELTRNNKQNLQVLVNRCRDKFQKKCYLSVIPSIGVKIVDIERKRRHRRW